MCESIARHARPNQFEVAITDDGAGIAAGNYCENPKNKRMGRGLVNMRERLASIFTENLS